MVDLPISKWIKKKIRRLIAIVEDTDVAVHSIASGKYVVWKGDLYKSTAAIAVGGTLSLSNLSPVSDGGLNELSEQIGNIVKNITITSANCSAVDHGYEVSKTTLGVDDCTQYEWFAHATNWNWECLPLVCGVATNRVFVREWVFSTATGNATLALQNGTLPYQFELVGIKK